MIKNAHFSIDDVGASLKYIFNKNPSSIFDLRLYSQLLKWHEQYKLVSTLYCIVNIEGFCISELPDKYVNEFADNADWLKFGFHAGDEHPFLQDLNYRESYYTAKEIIEKKKMGCTNSLRLHSWYASDEQESFLNSMGVTTIFMPPDCKEMYIDGEYKKNGITHRKTDIWFEKMMIDQMPLDVNRSFLTLFTHEWCFDEQKDKIDAVLSILKQNDYIFV